VRLDERGCVASAPRSGWKMFTAEIDYTNRKDKEMCQLCSDDEKEKKNAAEECRGLAERCERMAAYQYRLANGNLKPHSEDAKTVGHLAKTLIRELVAEYL
jgi:hypothetical protein